MDFNPQLCLEGTVKVPLETGDQFVDFATYNQDRKMIKLSEILQTSPVLLISSWSNAQNLRPQYLQRIAEIQDSITGAGWQIVIMGREFWKQLKEEKIKFRLDKCILIDDDVITDYKIANTYAGCNPMATNQEAWFINSYGMIVNHIKFNKWDDLDIFLDEISNYAIGGDIQ